MTWTKKTINLSKIDDIVFLLIEDNIFHKTSIIEKVVGQGINDLVAGGKRIEYRLRRLDYEDIIILECITQSYDMSLDDYILSHKFTKNTIPKEWSYKIGK